MNTVREDIAMSLDMNMNIINVKFWQNEFIACMIGEWYFKLSAIGYIGYMLLYDLVKGDRSCKVT